MRGGKQILVGLGLWGVAASVEAGACTLCSSKSATATRAEISAMGFGSTFMEMSAPIPILILAALGVAKVLGNDEKKR